MTVKLIRRKEGRREREGREGEPVGRKIGKKEGREGEEGREGGGKEEGRK